MQKLRESSFEIKRYLNWSESARINLPTVMAEWLFNFEPAIFEKNPKCTNTGSSDCFHFSSIFGVFMRFHLWFKHYWQVVYDDVTRDSVTCSLTLRHITENRYVKCPVHFYRWNIFYSLRCEHNFLTNWIAEKLMNAQKIKIFVNEINIILCKTVFGYIPYSRMCQEESQSKISIYPWHQEEG